MYHVTKAVLQANKLYYNSTLSSANCSEELYKITYNLLARTKQVYVPTRYPLSSLPELFCNYVSEKITKIRNELHAQIDVVMSAPETCSLDPIQTLLLLELLYRLLASLTALINSSLRSGLFSFPNFSNVSVTFPLLKKPSVHLNELKNLRPISNLPYISRIV